MRAAMLLLRLRGVLSATTPGEILLWADGGPGSEGKAGGAMIIAPGGGHAFLNFDREGTSVAEYGIGVAAFVLKYGLAREPGSTYTIEGHAFGGCLKQIGRLK